MKHSQHKTEKPMHLKRKLMSALSMLMVATILMTTTSYAWFVLSTAPEVTGITTNIGANGSLEIALLNTDTHADMETIRSGVAGNSLAANDTSANYSWGNLIDLGFGNYGLDSVVLLPARLNAIATDSGYAVDTGMLAVPSYGYDGRVMDLTDNTMSAIFQGNEFALVSGTQDYGVRAVGTADDISAQTSALALAKSNIVTYTNSTKTGVRTLMADSGNSLMNMVLAYSMNTDTTFGDGDRDILKNILTDMNTNVTYIDLALKQGIVAYAASQIADELLFNTVKDLVLSAGDVAAAVQSLGEYTEIPSSYTTWIANFTDLKNSVSNAINTCNALQDGSYTWDEIQDVLNCLMNMDSIYINNKLFGEMSKDELLGLATADSVDMTLAPGSGIFADIADFVGNLETVMSTMGIEITVKTASPQNPAYMDALSDYVAGLNSATGDSTSTLLSLTTTYGYALDLGFRTNADNADLLLQTTPEQRVYEESEAASTQGGGSYMEFSSTDDNLTMDKRLLLMDAIRVGFLDNQNNILGIGKLNISNRVVEDGVISAPLYLYDYSFESDVCGNYLVMGERRTTENQLTTLERNTGKALTVLVWLDGDLVDNTMVSANAATSLGGMLNLQFSTSADLIPAANDDLFNYTTDKSGLTALIQEYTDKFTAGQGTYTNVSWDSFVAAYTNAVSLSEIKDPANNQVQKAMLTLAKAALGLQEVSHETVNNQIQQLRDQYGSDTTAYYLIKDENGNVTTAGTDEYTQEEYDNWEKVGTINGIDNNTNLHDEGNGIYTAIYSTETWNTMAEALYFAELVTANPNATDDQLNTALANLKEAQKALEREVYYKPYEYKGAIYYEAICDADKADTYGKWYDSNFKRVINEITILNLDAYAVETQITQIDQTTYISNDETHIKPDVSILDKVYTELQDESFKGVKWDALDDNLFEEGLSQRHIEQLQSLYNEIINNSAIFYWKDVEVQQEVTGPDGKPTTETVITQELAIRKIEVVNDNNEGISLDQDHIVLEHVKTAAHILEKEQYPNRFPNESRATLVEVQQLIANLEASYAEIMDAYEFITVDSGNVYTTEKTQILLTKAIGNSEALLETIEAADAKALEDYNEELAKLESGAPKPAEPDFRMDDEDVVTFMSVTLPAARSRLSSILTLEEDAVAALDGLNNFLRSNGGTPATEYNTITQKLPSSAFSGDIVYTTEYPDVTLNLKGQTGSTTIGAQILTENGVVVSVQKPVVVYNKADGLEIMKASDPNADFAPESLESSEGNQFTLTSRLFYNEYKATKEGETVIPAPAVPEGEILENIDPTKITWASSNTKLATVSKNADGSCTITVATSTIDPEEPKNNFTVAGMTVYISLSVETIQGNTYYCSIPVSIT